MKPTPLNNTSIIKELSSLSTHYSKMSETIFLLLQLEQSKDPVEIQKLCTQLVQFLPEAEMIHSHSHHDLRHLLEIIASHPDA